VLLILIISSFPGFHYIVAGLSSDAFFFSILIVREYFEKIVQATHYFKERFDVTLIDFDCCILDQLAGLFPGNRRKIQRNPALMEYSAGYRVGGLYRCTGFKTI
jgi:hypothetical protein